MSTLRFRLFGTDDQSATMIAHLHGLDRLDRVEEVADQMRGVRDDSSSLNLPDDDGPGLHCIEVDVEDTVDVKQVVGIIERISNELDAGVEFVDRF